MGLPLGIPGVEEFFIRDRLRLAADHPTYFWRDHCPQKGRPSSLTYNPSRNVIFLRNYDKLLPGKLRLALR
jgi:hypothetical protein